MQDAIQSLKKIEETLYNFGCNHTGEKCMTPAKNYLFEKKKLISQNKT